jgi:hypothetical protein
VILISETDRGLDIVWAKHWTPPSFGDHIPDLESGGCGGAIRLDFCDNNPAAFLPLELE